MAILLNGTVLASQIYQQVGCAIDVRKQYQMPIPTLAVILVGDDPASHLYVNKKEQMCKKVGMHSTVRHLPATITEKTLIAQITALNIDASIHGILIQLPLPKSFNTTRILSAIDPKKDVDGLHPHTIGALAIAEPSFLPCTPLGIQWLLQHHQIDVSGKKVAMIGASNIVGKPLALLLLKHQCTVTICHINTSAEQLEQAVISADIVIIATGQKDLIPHSWFHSKQVIIDVGIHHEQQQVRGDVDYLALQSSVHAITPVPGGVGPMTIAALLYQTFMACENQSPCTASDLNLII